MALDLKQWLSDLAADGSLSTEEQALLLEKLNKPQVVKRLEEGQLRQADYSRAMNSLSEKEKATLKLQADLVAWKAEAEDKIKTANMSVAQERAARAQLETQARTYAEQYGLDPAALGIPATAGATPPNSSGTPAAPGNGNPPNPEYVAKKDWEENMRSMSASFPLLPAAIHDLSVQHQALYGKPLDNSTALVKKAMETGKTLQTVWEEEYKVAERRAQLVEDGIQARVNEAVQKRESELRSELQLPPTPRADAHSPILAQFRPSNPPTGQPEMSAVDAAVAAYGEHKYAPPEAKQ